MHSLFIRVWVLGILIFQVSGVEAAWTAKAWNNTWTKRLCIGVLVLGVSPFALKDVDREWRMWEFAPTKDACRLCNLSRSPGIREYFHKPFHTQINLSANDENDADAREVLDRVHDYLWTTFFASGRYSNRLSAPRHWYLSPVPNDWARGHRELVRTLVEVEDVLEAEAVQAGAKTEGGILALVARRLFPPTPLLSDLQILRQRGEIRLLQAWTLMEGPSEPFLAILDLMKNFSFENGEWRLREKALQKIPEDSAG
jgi:hypothetical protein